MTAFITGIQQAGIGVADAVAAKHLYKELFGMNTLIFEDNADASLMQRYTGDKIHSRHAILSMNLAGGGGFEIWQFTSRTAVEPEIVPRLGDLGIFAIKIKSADVPAAHDYFSVQHGVTVSSVMDTPDDRKHFWVTDHYGNQFEIVESDEWFRTNKRVCGGVTGAVIGVSDMEKAIRFYRELLGIEEVIYAGSAPMLDVPPGQIPGQWFNRVLLKKKLSNQGAFSKLLGSVQIELLEAADRTPVKIFGNRFWGDCGFIHLCFDVLDMNGLKKRFADNGFSFTVDSNDSFSMGSSAGRFCYVEDPDGTLIELVETHKIPILKKIGWHLDLRKRKADTPLPDWMINLLGLNKIH